jgi:hypothetical protein
LHRETLEGFLRRHRVWIHALELNGMRPWPENRSAICLARELGMPVISGGDRHGRQPNAVLNLTNSGTFAEFVSEIRDDRWSDILVLPEYHEPHRWRVLQNICDILRDDDLHSLGWTRWSDRIFYRYDDGTVRSLTEACRGNYPALMRCFVALIHSVDRKSFRTALRQAFGEKREFAL